MMQFELKDVKQYGGSKGTVVSGRLILNGNNDLENFSFKIMYTVRSRDDSHAGVRYDSYGRPKPQYGYNVSHSYSTYTAHDFFPSLLQQYTKKNNPALHEFKNLEIPFSYEIINGGKDHYFINASNGNETKSLVIKISKRLAKKRLIVIGIILGVVILLARLARYI